jgi:TolA-binding protein
VVQQQPAAGDQSGGRGNAGAGSDASASTGAPVQSGDANTDYNAAIALVQDQSRQDDAIAAFQNFVKNTLIQLISRMPTTGSVS